MDAHSLIAIPQSPADFKPPAPSSEIAEMAALLRTEEHWAELLPFVMAMAGVGRGPTSVTSMPAPMNPAVSAGSII